MGAKKSWEGPDPLKPSPYHFLAASSLERCQVIYQFTAGKNSRTLGLGHSRVLSSYSIKEAILPCPMEKADHLFIVKVIPVLIRFRDGKRSVVPKVQAYEGIDEA